MSFIVRLACVMHAASVNPEPGSNSHEKLFNYYFKIVVLSFVHKSFLIQALFIYTDLLINA